jgi:hypothetical protein
MADDQQLLNLVATGREAILAGSTMPATRT